MPNQQTQVSLHQAFLYWLKLGFISFGGPAGQLAMMHQELVEKRRWISEQRFLHALNYTMLLPGPEAQQLATYIGWLLHGKRGAFIAGLLFILPSFFILSLLAWLYLAYGDMPVVQGLLYGVKPAVTAIVLFAAWRLARKTLHTPALQALALLALIGIAGYNLPFPFIVFSAAVAGLALMKWFPLQLKVPCAHVSPEERVEQTEAVINDDSAAPARQRFSWRKLSMALAVGIIIWLAAIGLLAAVYGWHSTQTQLAWFFTKAALLTFGGAYAVLPYVYQAAVEQYQWLSALQMIDGLALGESTPGPLIMVVAFVGFVAGWSQQLFGADSLWQAGILAAAIVTFFTFLPSFLFIIAGAPLVEASRQHAAFTGPLTAVTAAVVGVIVNLALFFGYYVLWPTGFSGQFDAVALLLTIAAAIALFKFNQSILRVLAAAATTGMLLSLL
ncbi:MAG: chromate transporter [Rheinheimera sp.]|uniref:chromate efflux transporter n=1 Tax=Arsukibacterium sp. UBA3155 TaxID=1946058 RepID=UPI000C936403|nr:chromate efflux transporter [Arsukibacterium sp. UBA3155]MAD77040.1 chromate transporter [Rheinheimera sp.]|tara:strand:+ start:13357 stop:14688 length:1332 start_codon:yes stop_codon:yes gene_type:complete